MTLKHDSRIFFYLFSLHPMPWTSKQQKMYRVFNFIYGLTYVVQCTCINTIHQYINQRIGSFLFQSVYHLLCSCFKIAFCNNCKTIYVVKIKFEFFQWILFITIQYCQRNGNRLLTYGAFWATVVRTFHNISVERK
jgi:hypothetical protein